jgi:SH3-like domain-containing protein
MIQTLVCKKCNSSIKIDYDKAPKSEFTIACPQCSQKYKLTKPKNTQVSEAKPIEQLEKTQIKRVPCPKCKTVLGIDYSKFKSFPAVVTCKQCSTKLKIQNPTEQKAVQKQPSAPAAQLSKPKPTIDKSKIDPKNNAAYRLYYYTRKISYVNRITLVIYLSYLINSISKTLTDVKFERIDLESFMKFRAEVNALSLNIFNTTVNPILAENGINPRLVSWANSWFVKKLSSRVVLNIIKIKNVDRSIPYIKKYINEIEKENSSILKFLYSLLKITAALLVFGSLFIVPISNSLLLRSYNLQWQSILFPLISLGILYYMRKASYRGAYYIPINLSLFASIAYSLLIALPFFPDAPDKDGIIKSVTGEDANEWKSANYSELYSRDQSGWSETDQWFVVKNYLDLSHCDSCNPALKSVNAAYDYSNYLIIIAFAMLVAAVLYRYLIVVAELTARERLIRALDNFRTWGLSKFPHSFRERGVFYTWVRYSGIAILIAILVKLSLAFTFNSYGYSLEKKIFSDKVNEIHAKNTQAKMEGADNDGNDAYNTNQTVNNSQLPATPFYIINISAVSSEEEASQAASNLRSQGKSAGYLWIPDFKSLSGAQMFSVFIGPYYSQNDCEVATESIKLEMPNAYGLLVSQEERRVQINGLGKVIINGIEQSQVQSYSSIEIIDPPSNVRSCASTSCDVVDQCTVRGERIKLISEEGEWANVETSKGIRGYLHKTQYRSEKKTFNTTVDKMNLRETPGFGAKVITILPINSSVEYLNVKSDFQDAAKIQGQEIMGYWYKVRTSDGSIGWIHGCCISGI